LVSALSNFKIVLVSLSNYVRVVFTLYISARNKTSRLCQFFHNKFWFPFLDQTVKVCEVGFYSILCVSARNKTLRLNPSRSKELSALGLSSQFNNTCRPVIKCNKSFLVKQCEFPFYSIRTCLPVIKLYA